MVERLNSEKLEEEFLDVVDDSDTVVGKVLRSEIDCENFRKVRSVAGFIINSKNQVWIPRRSPSKRLFPQCLDMSFAGYVKSGEDYDDAAKREMQEELHMDPENTNLIRIGKLSPGKEGVSSFIGVYLLRSDQWPSYNTSDFSGASWMSLRELIGTIMDGEKAKSDLLILARFLLSNL